jgi:hypothetical protein
VVQVLRDAYARHAGVLPDPDLVADMLATWSAPCAKAISADWGLSSRMQRALEEQGDAVALQPGDALARALRRQRALAAGDRLALYERQRDAEAR